MTDRYKLINGERIKLTDKENAEREKGLRYRWNIYTNMYELKSPEEVA